MTRVKRKVGLRIKPKCWLIIEEKALALGADDASKWTSGKWASLVTSTLSTLFYLSNEPAAVRMESGEMKKMKE